MQEQLQANVIDPRLQQLLVKIRDLARDKKGEYLKEGLEKLVISDFDELGDVRNSIINVLIAGDYALKECGEALASKLFRGSTTRKYALITKCNQCADSPKERMREGSKLRQDVPVKDYVHESQINDLTILSDLKNAGFKDTCDWCEAPLEITSTSNLIVPVDDEPVFMIAQRVKSVGRYCEKLVDRIFYNENDLRMKKRSLLDRYAFAVLVNFPNDFNEKQFRRNFWNQFGATIPDNGLFEDAVCNAFFTLLKNEYQIDARKTQDNIKDPKKVVKDGRVEYYKMLQFPFPYKEYTFEGQIKTKRTYLREQDRKSVIDHETYVEKERQLRNNMLKDIPEARIVYNLLMRLFSDRTAC